VSGFASRLEAEEQCDPSRASGSATNAGIQVPCALSRAASAEGSGSISRFGLLVARSCALIPAVAPADLVLKLLGEYRRCNTGQDTGADRCRRFQAGLLISVCPPPPSACFAVRAFFWLNESSQASPSCPTASALRFVFPNLSCHFQATGA
jgi:hypothetical protein